MLKSKMGKEKQTKGARLPRSASRKKSDYTLKASEEQFRGLVEVTSDLIWQVNQHGVYTYISPKIKDILGYEPAYVLGKTPFNFMPKDEAKKISEVFHGFIKQKAPFYYLNNWNIHKNGSFVLLETSGVPIIDNKGQLIGYRGIDRDITEVKRYEENTIIAKEKLQKILNSLDDGVTLTGLDGKVTDCNEASLRLTGLTRDEFIGMNVYDIITPEDRQQAIEGALKVLETGKFVNQVSVLRKNGSVFCAEISVTVLCDKAGKTVGFLGVTRDITQRKKFEEELAKKQEELQIIIDSSPMWIFFKDKNNRFLRVNKAFAESMELSKEDMEGKSNFDIFPKEQAEKFWADDKQVMASKKSKTGIIEQQLSKKGLLWVQTDKVPYRDAQGNIIGVIGFVQNISEYKKLQQQLENYNRNLEETIKERTKQLKESERFAAIGQTAAMVGHDLRNPLQSIVGEAYLIENELKSLPDGAQKTNLSESIKAIAEQTSYMDKIVSDLQAFVKPVEIHKETVDFKQLIIRVLEQTRTPNIQTIVNVKDGTLLTADAQMLKRVLINLVTNSIQAMPNGGALTVTTKAIDSERLQINVEDTGSGIPDNIKPKIFMPLFTTKAKGQGFGLAVCKRVIEAQGGIIFFESQEGKGTKFTIELPIFSTNFKG